MQPGKRRFADNIAAIAAAIMLPLVFVQWSLLRPRVFWLDPNGPLIFRPDPGGLPSWSGQKEESSLVGSSFGGIPSPSSSVSNSACSGNMSPTLGKHSRDGSTPAEDAMKQNLWVPKTVRINDPEEAARSSIWSTCGTKSEQSKPIMKGSAFKSFEPKSDGSSHI